MSSKQNSLIQGRSYCWPGWGGGGMGSGPLDFFFFFNLVYIYIILFLVICFNKIALFPLNNIIDIFKSYKKILAQ